MSIRRLVVSFFVAATAMLGPAQAQDWPARPVTIIHPFPAGGGADNVLRVIAQDLTDKFGKPFTVENRTGAGGIVGSVAAAKAAPDGYTFILSSIGPAVLNQLLLKSIPYNTDRDFTPVVLVGEIPQVIISDPKLGFKTLGDLVAYGKQNPGKLNIGHAGAGSMGNLTGALFLARTGIKGTLVAYRGAMPVVTDVIGGQIQAGVPIFLPPARKATILAVTSEKRIPFLPDIPTTREAGVDLVASTWIALMAPAGTPQDIVAKVNAEINRFMASPEGVKAFTNGGIRSLGGTPAELADTIKRDRALWAPVIEKEGIKLDTN